MADYTNQNNGGANVFDVRTNSIALFASDSNMLRISFTGDKMFLTIIPRVADPNGGRARWPKEMGKSACFTPQTALALYDGFSKNILPDIEKGVDHDGNCVVPLNREASNLCGFSWIAGHACFSIFLNVHEDRTCNEQATFMFEPITLIDSYNPTTGTYVVKESQAQLYVIVEALRMFGLTATSAVGHNVKNASAWNTDMIQSHLRAIVTKLGATPGELGRYRGSMGGYSGNNNNFGGYGMDRPQGSSSFTQPALATPSPLTGENDAVAWGAGITESGSIGRPDVVPDVHQVSSLDSVMA